MKERAQAVLIRACIDADGPGKLTKRLKIDKYFNQKSIIDNDELFLEDDGERFEIISDKRVGIDYASLEDINKQWRFKIGKKLT